MIYIPFILSVFTFVKNVPVSLGSFSRLFFFLQEFVDAVV